MKKEDSVFNLKTHIELLEEKKSADLLLLKAQFLISIESIKPANLIKDTFKELTSDPEFKGDIIKTSLSIATGYISKRMVMGETHNPIKQFFGTLLQMGVTNVVAKNSDTIKSAIESLFSKKDKPEE